MQLMIYSDFSMASPSVSVETDPERFPCPTSALDSFNCISASVCTKING